MSRNFVMPVASQTLTLYLSLLVVHLLVWHLLHCWKWKSIVPPRVTSWHCFRMPTAFSRIALTLEPLLKNFGLLTTVGAWSHYLLVLSALQLSVAIAYYAVSIHGSTRASAYFDLARAMSFDPTVLNLVAIRPYIVTQCL